MQIATPGRGIFVANKCREITRIIVALSSRLYVFPGCMNIPFVKMLRKECACSLECDTSVYSCFGIKELSGFRIIRKLMIGIIHRRPHTQIKGMIGD